MNGNRENERAVMYRRITAFSERTQKNLFHQYVGLVIVGALAASPFPLGGMYSDGDSDVDSVGHAPHRFADGIVRSGAVYVSMQGDSLLRTFPDETPPVDSPQIPPQRGDADSGTSYSVPPAPEPESAGLAAGAADTASVASSMGDGESVGDTASVASSERSDDGASVASVEGVALRQLYAQARQFVTELPPVAGSGVYADMTDDHSICVVRGDAFGDNIELWKVIRRHYQGCNLDEIKALVVLGTNITKFGDSFLKKLEQLRVFVAVDNAQLRVVSAELLMPNDRRGQPYVLPIEYFEISRSPQLTVFDITGSTPHPSLRHLVISGCGILQGPRSLIQRAPLLQSIVLSSNASLENALAVNTLQHLTLLDLRETGIREGLSGVHIPPAQTGKTIRLLVGDTVSLTGVNRSFWADLKDRLRAGGSYYIDFGNSGIYRSEESKVFFLKEASETDVTCAPLRARTPIGASVDGPRLCPRLTRTTTELMAEWNAEYKPAVLNGVMNFTRGKHARFIRHLLVNDQTGHEIVSPSTTDKAMFAWKYRGLIFFVVSAVVGGGAIALFTKGMKEAEAVASKHAEERTGQYFKYVTERVLEEALERVLVTCTGIPDEYVALSKKVVARATVVLGGCLKEGTLPGPEEVYDFMQSIVCELAKEEVLFLRNMCIKVLGVILGAELVAMFVDWYFDGGLFYDKTASELAVVWRNNVICTSSVEQMYHAAATSYTQHLLLMVTLAQAYVMDRLARTIARGEGTFLNDGLEFRRFVDSLPQLVRMFFGTCTSCGELVLRIMGFSESSTLELQRECMVDTVPDVIAEEVTAKADAEMGLAAGRARAGRRALAALRSLVMDSGYLLTGSAEGGARYLMRSRQNQQLINALNALKNAYGTHEDAAESDAFSFGKTVEKLAIYLHGALVYYEV